MVRVSSERVRLALADWVGLCSLALTLVMLVGATLFKVHDVAADERARQARVELELVHLKSQMERLQRDVQALVRGERA